MDIAAIALCANMVEKTITLDRTTPSVEHLFSIEPDEMNAFATSIRNLETAMGHPGGGFVWKNERGAWAREDALC